MAVSHYLVSALGLVGYVITIVGLTLAASAFLSTHMRRRWLAGLTLAVLPAAIIGSLDAAGVLMFPLYRFASTNLLYMAGMGVVYFAIGYSWAGHAERGPLLSKDGYTYFVLRILFWSFLAITVILLAVMVMTQRWVRWPIAVWPAVAALGSAFMLRLVSHAPKLSERQLQAIGFFAAILGGAMLALPFFLDMLNIPIH